MMCGRNAGEEPKFCSELLVHFRQSINTRGRCTPLVFDIFVFQRLQAIQSPMDAPVRRQATSVFWCKTHVDPVRLPTRGRSVNARFDPAKHPAYISSFCF